MSLPGDAGDGWQRLDRRMLFVHPIREVVRFLPALIGLFVAGRASGGMDVQWQLVGIGVPVTLGVFRYLTTSFRIGGDRVELRRGLVSRHLLSTRLDRVRTVDLSSSPVQRVLGLSTVRIGTGTASTSDEDQVELDGLPTERARALRHELLASGRPDETDVAESSEGAAGVTASPDADPVLLELDRSWARFAPLTSTGVLLTGAALGLGSQVLGELGVDPSVRVEDTARLLVLLPLVVVGVLVSVTVLAVAGYLVTNWGFTLSRSARDGSWHLRRGLLTSRETSIDDERVGGVTLGEPVGLRLAGGARLGAIVTGLDREGSSSAVLVPPAPLPDVQRVAGDVLGTASPVTGPLTGHGPAAVRRRWSRALAPAGPGAVALAAAVALGLSPWLLLLAAALLGGAALLARDRAAALGHALVEGYLVARSGSLLRQRQILATDAVIGWTFHATWFQRRVGLTSLVATTAGGPQSVTVLDAPEGVAVALADAAVPHLIAQFVARR